MGEYCNFFFAVMNLVFQFLHVADDLRLRVVSVKDGMGQEWGGPAQNSNLSLRDVCHFDIQTI